MASSGCEVKPMQIMNLLLGSYGSFHDVHQMKDGNGVGGIDVANALLVPHGLAKDDDNFPVS